MTSEDRINQSKVGVFILIGLITIGLMVVYFGRVGEGMRSCYTLRAEFPNASGLRRQADVLLAGAKIGRVVNDPVILPDMDGVYVDLRIFNNVKIPSKSEFSIGSSGLLGDHIVTVTLGSETSNLKPIAPGSVITNGMSESSISEIQRQMHDEILPKLNTALDNIGVVTLALKRDVFNEQGVRNLQATLSNFRVTSDALAASSGQIRQVVDQASLFLRKGNSTMDSAKGAAGDLKVFIANLRQHGILFYRDTTIPEAFPSAGPVKKQP